ncbi:ABC transporter ATP-binding protein [Haloferula rosea]|uniref:ABC transporter ATP-binding protein n=1 Tax=Haloferula rosea TaxID=490093 RepID=A0A934RD04_9BACT|nr:ABC transporter ATP-binding protein [Haloferula rosea]MBK1826781.1 ABC transporter ATP-binding protein [Haloferula rosea]
MISAQQISKSYETPGETVEVLKGLSLELADGEAAAITGPSGCGKTTLLNLLGALDRPTSGSIDIGGQKIAELSDEEATHFRNHSLGFVFQQHYLLPQLSVLENVLVPRLAGDWQESESDTTDRARDLLEKVGLGHRLNHLPWQLSGGEKLRTAVARALVNQPKLVLADEPTGSLDPASTDTIADLLLELNQDQKTTLLVVTHNHALAHRIGRTLELRDGALWSAMAK